MNKLSRIVSNLFKISVVLLTLYFIFALSHEFISWKNSIDRKLAKISGKNFLIENGLVSLIDIGDSSLKLLDNGEMSLRFRMTPVGEKYFKSTKTTLIFELLDSDNFFVDEFKISNDFVRSLTDDGETNILSFSGIIKDISGEGGINLHSILLTEKIVLNSYVGLELVEYAEVIKQKQIAIEKSQAELENSIKSKIELDYKKKEEWLRSNLELEYKQKQEAHVSVPLYTPYSAMDFEQKVEYENNHALKIKVGMTASEMKSAGKSFLMPRKIWTGSEYGNYGKTIKEYAGSGTLETRYHRKMGEGEAYRYGDYIIYFRDSMVAEISLEPII